MKGKRKPYTLSETALEQRRAASKRPKRRLKGNFNAFKHGKHSGRINFDTMPFSLCEKCLFFEIVKGRFEIIVFKAKKSEEKKEVT
ncbi:MAG: hypothetical protein M0Z71_05145 [Nitrospiraceae bacterium]|nr:hypothetical protein [Nitrospiraceae bacterium]